MGAHDQPLRYHLVLDPDHGHGPALGLKGLILKKQQQRVPIRLSA
jgi:hypothetical protein